MIGLLPGAILERSEIEEAEGKTQLPTADGSPGHNAEGRNNGSSYGTAKQPSQLRANGDSTEGVPNGGEQETKIVMFKKEAGGKWEAKFSPNVSKRDTNRLMFAIQSEFRRMKKNARKERRVKEILAQEIQSAAE